MGSSHKRKISCLRKSWHEEFMDKNFINEYQNEISFHENEISVHRNEMFMHKNGNFAQKRSWVKILCTQLYTAQLP